MNDRGRRQIIQRYVTDKAMAGADLGEISKGIVDPVKQMKTITKSGPQKASSLTSSPRPANGAAFSLFVLFALAVICLFFRALF